MTTELKPGLTKTANYEIDPGRCIGFMGDEARVYATPFLIYDIEMTGRDLLLDHIESSQDSVGTHVNIDQTAPTLQGMTVKITATLTDVDGRSVTFDVQANDGIDDIARCTHKRFIVDVDKIKQNLAAKAAKL
jgi:predicted thioesterase